MLLYTGILLQMCSTKSIKSYTAVGFGLREPWRAIWRGSRGSSVIKFGLFNMHVYIYIYMYIVIYICNSVITIYNNNNYKYIYI